MASNIYFIKCHEFVKIGVARKINERLSALQLGNPYPLELIGFGTVGSKEVATTIENVAHNIFRSNWHMGEWFYLNPVEEWLQGSLIERKRITLELMNRQSGEENYSQDFLDVLDDMNRIVQYGDMYEYHRAINPDSTSAIAYKSSLISCKWAKHKCAI